MYIIGLAISPSKTLAAEYPLSEGRIVWCKELLDICHHSLIALKAKLVQNGEQWYDTLSVQFQ